MSKKALDTKTAEEILEPQALTFEAGGRTFNILPLPDGAVMPLMKSFNTLMSVFTTAVAVMPRDENGEPITDAGTILTLIPEAVTAIWPQATEITCACLQVDSEWLGKHLNAPQRLKALRLIIEANDLVALWAELGNWKALAAQVPGLSGLTSPTQTEKEESPDLAEEPSTSS